MSAMRFLFTGIILSMIIIENVSGCGVQEITPSIDISARITNGEDAVPNSWPWVVSLRDASTGKHVCGGTLVSEDLIMTAGKCFDKLKKEKMVVAIGTNNLDEALTPSNSFSISEVIFHPKFNSGQFLNDAALVRLSKSVTFSAKVSAICLPETTDVEVIFGKTVVIAGWGTKNGKYLAKDLSNTLLQAKVDVRNSFTKPQSLCKGADKLNYCAIGSSNPKTNICFGDAGGPLMYKMNGKWYLYGITSYLYVQGTTCLTNTPGFYSMVPLFRDDFYNNYIQAATQPTGTASTRMTTSAPGTNTTTFKFSASLRYVSKNNNRFICSASIITPEYLLASASCFESYCAEEITVVIGLNQLTQNLNQQNSYSISEVTYHPSFNLKERLNDFVLIKLTKAISTEITYSSVCTLEDVN